MPVSCFGCCSIRSGINCIFIFNTLYIASMLMVHFMYRLSDYNLFYKINNAEINSSHALSQERDENQQLQHYNYTAGNLYQPLKTIPILNIFMDYILVIRSGWYIMEFYLNVTLKHSTNAVSLNSIYSWLVIYYFDLGRTIIVEIITITKKSIWTVFLNFFDILIVCVEVYIVQVFYNQQKLYAFSNFVHFKRKYLPKTKTQTDQT